MLSFLFGGHCYRRICTRTWGELHSGRCTISNKNGCINYMLIFNRNIKSKRYIRRGRFTLFLYDY